MYSNDSFNTPTKARKFSFCCPGAPMKKPRLSNDEPLLINDVNVNIKHDGNVNNNEIYFVKDGESYKQIIYTFVKKNLGKIFVVVDSIIDKKNISVKKINNVGEEFGDEVQVPLGFMN